MPIIACSACGKKLSVPDQFYNKRFKCPGCQSIISFELEANTPPPIPQRMINEKNIQVPPPSKKEIIIKPLVPDAEKPPSNLEKPEPPRQMRFFEVSKFKLIILSLCSFGIYELYWFYKNWKAEKDHTGENISPFAQALFAPLTAYSFFGKVNAEAKKIGIPFQSTPSVLALVFILFNILWRLPDPYWLISLLSFIPLLPVVDCISKINAYINPRVIKNDNFSTSNWILIVCGGILLGFVCFESFLPEMPIYGYIKQEPSPAIGPQGIQGTGSHINQGEAYFKQGKYPEAIADFTKAIELDPKLAVAYSNRGVAYLDGLKKFPEAIADFTKVIELDPKLAVAYLNRGQAFYNLEKNVEAIADCTKAIELDTKLALAYLLRGMAYQGLKGFLGFPVPKYPEAIADFTKAIELDPKLVDAYNLRGVTYLDGLKKYPEAVADFTNAIELDPKLAVTYINRGIAYSDGLKKFPEAIADFTKAIELDPKLVDVYNLRGVTYLSLTGFLGFSTPKYPEAIADFTKAIELDHKQVTVYHNRGIAYSDGLKKFPEAIADFTKAIELDPKLAIAYQNRGLALKAMGKNKEGDADLAKYKKMEQGK
jgi:tetratricopeptide (TPR) repeat protein